mgnify:CR=1 FL=1
MCVCDREKVRGRDGYVCDCVVRSWPFCLHHLIILVKIFVACVNFMNVTK